MRRRASGEGSAIEATLIASEGDGLWRALARPGKRLGVGDRIGFGDALAAEVRAWPGDAIVSHEILGTASHTQAVQALADLDGPDTELHLVVSVRDLVRQVPAEWQENVKHRRSKTYGDFLAELRDPARPTEVAQWFWGVQEVPDVLARWGSTLPPERPWRWVAIAPPLPG